MQSGFSRTTSFVAVIFLCATISSTLGRGAVSANEIEYRTLVLSTDQVPGFPDGVTFNAGLFPGIINDQGQVVFQTHLFGIGRQSHAEFLLDNDQLSLLTLQGELVPDLPFTFWDEYVSVAGLSNDGLVLRHANVEGPIIDDSNDSGIWLGVPGDLRLVAREGDPLPVGEGQFQQIVQGTSLNDNGLVAFAAFHGEPDRRLSGGGVWLGDDTMLHSVVQDGDAAPGTGVFFGREFRAPRLNAVGQILFEASLTNTADENFFQRSLWLSDGPDLRLIAQTNEFLTNTSQRVRIRGGQSLLNYHLSNDGEVTFAAETVVSNSEANHEIQGTSIFTGRPDDMRLVASTEQSAPGTPVDVHFGRVDMRAPLTNDRGDIVFAAELWGPNIDPENAHGVWIETDGELRKVMREGDPVPGLGPGVVFGELRMNQLTLNSHGQIAFEVGLRGGGYQGERSIWATDADQTLHLVAMEGEPFALGDGDFKTVRSEGQSISVGFVPNPSDDLSPRSSFNDSGELVFWLGFDDFTSGLFVASIPIPEPTSYHTFVGILVGFLLLRSRYRPKCVRQAGAS